MVAQERVLDHGFVKLLNVATPEGAGVENSIAMAARVSFGHFVETEEFNAKTLRLIDYLYRNAHMSPFEMVELWFHVKLPIFVARQLVRHRTMSLNEISARYTTLPDDFYIPENLHGKAVSNKQGRGERITGDDEVWLREHMDVSCQNAYSAYRLLLDRGVAPEMARMVLPVNIYTEWLCKMNVRNFLHFVKLRTDEHAQYEAREYANAMFQLFRKVAPDLCHIVERHDFKSS